MYKDIYSRQIGSDGRFMFLYFDAHCIGFGFKFDLDCQTYIVSLLFFHLLIA